METLLQYPFKFILILEKTFTNQGKVIEISLENSIIPCLFPDFV